MVACTNIVNVSLEQSQMHVSGEAKHTLPDAESRYSNQPSGRFAADIPWSAEMQLEVIGRICERD